MNDPDTAFTAQAAQEIAATPRSRLAAEPLPISPWLAMSLMQKAVRRDEPDWAWRAAVTLLESTPERLWRRLLVTAFEDIGVADLPLTAQTVAACRGKTVRKLLGGEHRAAYYLVTAMSRAGKCRAADDLACCADWDGSCNTARLRLLQASRGELGEQLAGPGDIVERGLALWLLLGTERCASGTLPRRAGDEAGAFEALTAATGQPTAVATAREGYRRSRLILAPFWGLLLGEQPGSHTDLQDDDLPEAPLVGGVPCWALDIHCREGRRAIASFLKTDTPSARWARRHLAPEMRVGFLGGVLFRVESSLVRRRLQWPVGGELRTRADRADLTFSRAALEEIAGLLRADLPVLNEARDGLARAHLG